MSSQKPTSEAPKRQSTSAVLETSAVSETSADSASTEPSARTNLYSRPLPVYNRMNKVDTNKTDVVSTSSVPTTSEPRALASVIADSVKSGDAAKSMKKLPETSSKPMFFKAARTSRATLPAASDNIDNVVKLETSKLEAGKPGVAVQSTHDTQSSQATVKEKKSPPPTAAKPKKPGATLTRKESLKEQYNKLQVCCLFLSEIFFIFNFSNASI